MGKPTEQELDEALKTAAEMREHNNDPHYVAKSLLNLNYRMGYMEKVFHAAKLYMRGMGEHERTVLQKAINEAQDKDRLSAGRDDDLII